MGRRARLPVAVCCVAALAVTACSRDDSVPHASPSTSTVAATIPPTTSKPTKAAVKVCTHENYAVKQDPYRGVLDPLGTGLSIDVLAAHWRPGPNRLGQTIQSDAGVRVAIVGRDGTAFINRPGGLAVPTRYGDLGDLAGDGRLELAVNVQTGPKVNGWYVVPTDLAPGTHDPLDVGIRIPLTEGEGPIPVGDQNGDGADDFAVGLNIYSGRAFLKAKRLPSPMRTLPQRIEGVLQLHEGAPPSLLVIAGKGPAAEVRILDRPPIRLYAPRARTGITSSVTGGAAQVSGWIVNAHPIVQLSLSGRGGAYVLRWNLDSPCVH